MKFIRYCIFFLVCVCPRLDPAQSVNDDGTKVADAVLKASAQRARVKIAEDAYKFLVDDSVYADASTKTAIQTAARDDSSFLKNSLSKYLLLKSIFLPPERKELMVADFADFDWDTFAKFNSFQPVKAKDGLFYFASGNGVGSFVGSTKGSTNTPSKGKGIEIGGNSYSTFLLPTDGKAALAHGFDSKGRAVLLTYWGAASDTPLFVRSVASDLCEIDVSSDPTEADVYFN